MADAGGRHLVHGLSVLRRLERSRDAQSRRGVDAAGQGVAQAAREPDLAEWSSTGWWRSRWSRSRPPTRSLVAAPGHHPIDARQAPPLGGWPLPIACPPSAAGLCPSPARRSLCSVVGLGFACWLLGCVPTVARLIACWLLDCAAVVCLGRSSAGCASCSDGWALLASCSWGAGCLASLAKSPWRWLGMWLGVVYLVGLGGGDGDQDLTGGGTA